MRQLLLPLPSNLGLQWGMSKQACLQKLLQAPLRQSEHYVLVELQIWGRPYVVELIFGNDNSLNKIQTVLFESCSFWEEFIAEDVEQAMAQAEGYYADTLKQYVVELGLPKFSGKWGTEGYPSDQSAWHITYWDQTEGRVQVELDQPDREFPFLVRVVGYRVN